MTTNVKGNCPKCEASITISVEQPENGESFKTICKKCGTKFLVIYNK